MKICVFSRFEGCVCLCVHLVCTYTLCVCLCVCACNGGSINCQTLSSRAAEEPPLTLPHLGDLGSY